LADVRAYIFLFRDRNFCRLGIIDFIWLVASSFCDHHLPREMETKSEKFVLVIVDPLAVAVSKCGSADQLFGWVAG
jgi:hypothetical protein